MTTAGPTTTGRASSARYPLRLEGRLDPGLSRWLWVVKWFLALPHYVVLAFLWLGFVVATVVAFVAILVTGRYPRVLFDYDVGVLRWSWRVAHYSWSALGTDRYPPFTLEDVPDYPAHLDVDYPEHLSRGLVLVKWWLLALPHHVVVGLLIGGGIWVAGRDDPWLGIASGGLIGILVLVAAVVLAFTGRYPVALYDLVLGLNRWVYRVAAYAALMTDVYPPFRLDVGGEDPGRPAPLGPPPAPGGAVPHARPAATTTSWTGGRVALLVVGALLAVSSLGLLGAGAVVLVGFTALLATVASGARPRPPGGPAVPAPRSRRTSSPVTWTDTPRVAVDHPPDHGSMSGSQHDSTELTPAE